MAILLWAGFAMAQQPVVQVPANCNVVVAGTGTGAVTGMGGKVGNGGVVLMPDPGNGSFTIIDNGATLNSWKLWGDISFSNPFDVSPAIDQSKTATTTPATIYSYNKNPRLSEINNLARSKGQVWITYNSGGCGGRIEFDIFKQYDNSDVPEIVGEDCWLPNKDYTYSVDQIASDNLGDEIGVDEYYWTVTNDSLSISNIYTSADKSSITFRTPVDITDNWEIKVCYGRGNGWDGNAAGIHTTCVTKTIGTIPSEPQYTTAPPSCLATGVSTFSVVIDPESIVPGYSYTWSAEGTSWGLTQSGTQDANVNVEQAGNNPGILTLTIGNGSCDPITFTYPVNRSLSSSTAISGSNCVTAGTSNVYSLPESAQINSTVWTLPDGWTIQSSGTNTPKSIINVSVPSNAEAGTYILTAATVACPESSISYSVNVRPQAPVFVTLPAGTSPKCISRTAGTPVTYTVTESPGASGYLWTFPAGWSVTSVTTTLPTVTVTPGGTGTAATATVSVRALGAVSTCSSTTVNYTISYASVKPDSITASCWNYGVAGETTITVANAPGYGTYTVSSFPTGLFTSYTADSNGEIKLQTSAAATGDYTLYITHKGGSSCTEETTSFPITMNGNGATLLLVGTSPGVENCDTYSVQNRPIGSTLEWFVNGERVYGNGSTVNIFANILNLCGNENGSPTVCVEVSLNGCITRKCLNPGDTGTHGARMATGTKDTTATSENINIYPNPNNGEFVIRVSSLKNNGTATILDSSGKKIKSQTLKEGDNNILMQKIPQGNYIVVLEIDGKSEARKIVIK